MRSCTADFLAAAIAEKRFPKAKVDVVWTDPYIDPSIAVTVSEDNRASVKDHAADLITTTPYKYFLLDGTSILDGTCHFFPGTVAEKAANQVGWYGNTLSNAGNGSFSVPYPTIEVEFDPRPVYGVYVVGEPTLNQYPVDFEVYIYNSTSLLTHLLVNGNTSVEFMQETIFDEATKIILVIKKWSAYGVVSKITEFYTSITKTYYGDDIVSMNLLQEREIRDGSLPVGNISSNELDIEFQNIKMINGASEIIDPFFPANDDSFLRNLIKPNRKITAYIGFQLPSGSIEYMKLGTFWSGDWEIDESSLVAETSCRDRMELLRRAKIKNFPLYEDTNLYDLAEAVLDHAILNIAALADMTYDIDSELESFDIPFGWFEDVSYFEAIRKISEACLGQAYMDADDVLVIESYTANIPSSDSYDLQITKDNYFTKKQPFKSEELVNVVNVETQPLIAEVTSDDTVYTSEEAISIGASATLDPITIKYTDVPIKDASADFTEITGGISLEYTVEEYYSCGAVLTVKNNTASPGTFKITVDGTKLEVNGSEQITTQDEGSIASNGRMEYTYPKNHLVQSRDVAEIIVDALIDSYAIERKDIETDWRGNPAIELGDLVEIPEYQRFGIDNRANFKVYKNRLSYDGTLRGILNGRKINQYEVDTMLMQDGDSGTPYQDTDGSSTQWQDGDL